MARSEVEGKSGTSKEARKRADRGRTMAPGAGLGKRKKVAHTGRSVMTAHGRMQLDKKAKCMVCGKNVLRAGRAGLWFHPKFLKGEAHYEHQARPIGKTIEAL